MNTYQVINSSLLYHWKRICNSKIHRWDSSIRFIKYCISLWCEKSQNEWLKSIRFFLQNWKSKNEYNQNSICFNFRMAWFMVGWHLLEKKNNIILIHIWRMILLMACCQTGSNDWCFKRRNFKVSANKLLFTFFSLFIIVFKQNIFLLLDLYLYS